MANANMKLTAFRVTNFRSVRDSGWIDTDDVTSLIGTNESGKTNLLVPLWKLNPANEGEIKLLSDAPRKDYNAFRQLKPKPDFIHARFALNDSLVRNVAALTGKTNQELAVVEVSRDFDGNYRVHFPNAQAVASVSKSDLRSAFDIAKREIEAATPSGKGDESLKDDLLRRIDEAIQAVDAFDSGVGLDGITKLQGQIDQAALKGAPQRSTIAPRFGQVVDLLEEHAAQFAKPGPDENAEVFELITSQLPVFVYYTTYGNLDSEIYLPHVIDDLKRTDLSGRSEARARTLRVLFDFVRLKPQEILELGRDWNEQQGKPNDDQIQALNEKKKERSVLLQSAGTELTTKFRDWWKQGEYRIRFEADGNHFRIWVSDDKRPEEIELEGRSTGLQWFLSFYLIFLVESNAAHNGAVLLLDEPGHSLHPIAQRDLAVFFENLATSNQLLYTTHSPFLVDADHLDRVRAVYVDDHGLTAVSTNLRAGQAAAQSNSIYPVHAALGLSVSDTLFQGCRPIVAEGQSDQLYLSAIKTVLIGLGKLKPTREILFVPTSGAKAIKTVAAILAGKNDDLPLVLCDADSAGKTLAKTLKDNMYREAPDRVLLISEFTGKDGTQVEDLFPWSFLTPIVDRFLKGPHDDPFTPDPDQPSIVDQIKQYAVHHRISLPDGWKVDLARLVKSRLTTETAQTPDWNPQVAIWQNLFNRLVGVSKEVESKEQIPKSATRATEA